MGHNVEIRKAHSADASSFPQNFLRSAAHTMICHSLADKFKKIKRRKAKERKVASAEDAMVNK